ncbi:MAG: signal recognition particle-docking protein FtsY [Cyanobacteria bacterium]|nr:signal recognition particle-docking protein FtsY [Cyanobacteriota bacterium]
MFGWFKKQSSPESSPLAGNLLNTSKQLLGSLFGATTPSGPGISETLSPLEIEELITELEENLIKADVGVNTAVEICDQLRQQKSKLLSKAALISALKQAFTDRLAPVKAQQSIAFNPQKLNIYLFVGVNGAGKTTTIGKLAHQFVENGHKVVIGAGDSFRAAAEDQLAVWAERAGASLVRQDGAEASGVIYDAIRRAVDTQANVVLLDTAGRLQNKFNLMEELRKIRAVIDKARPEESIFESLLVIDATTGQNALKQASVFQETVDLSGVILTKLDGSAKGGVILAVAHEYRLPIKWVGVGEKITDLQPFDSDAFLEALFASPAASQVH